MADDIDCRCAEAKGRRGVADDVIHVFLTKVFQTLQLWVRLVE